MINVEKKLETYYSRPEFARVKSEQKVNLMQELLQIKIATLENLMNRGDLPKSIYKELVEKYNDELNDLSCLKPSSYGLLNIVKSLREKIKK